MSSFEISLSKSGSASAAAETLVIFATQKSTSGASAKKTAKATPNGKTVNAALAHPTLAKRLNASLTSGAISGKAKESLFFRDLQFENYAHVLVVGLGSKNDGETLRQAAAAAFKALSAAKVKSAVVVMDSVSARDAAAATQAITEGFVLASYKFDELKTKKKDAPENKISVSLLSTKAADKGVKSAFQQGMILAEATNFSRRLGDMPGNLMTPTILANSAAEACKGTKVKATIWDKKRIEKEKMGGLLGVAQGSDQEPRFIILEYKGAAASKKPVVFVGKGLTFDCGGVSIKPSAAMEEMKYDMCGGANVIGAMLAIAKLGLKVNVIGLVPSTENMVNGSATKPGDVHTARNGKTFEVNNTDAEGRLILADALAYGSELNPEVMFDAATLTGAIVVALGNIHTGYFTRDNKMRDRIEKAAAVSGEVVWGMPLVDAHTDDMKGTYADLSNTSSSKGAGSATAAAFLEQFVGEGIPWAHFDIAGTAWSAGNRLNYCPAKGATGAMVRTFVELARQFSGK